MHPLIESMVIIWLYMSTWFIASVVLERNDVVDTAWGAGFVLLAWYHLFIMPDPTDRSFLLALLVTVWGVRLVWHISRRNHGKSEDFRYEAWRAQWGKHVYIRSYLEVFLLQGALLIGISAAYVLALRSPYRVALGIPDWIGLGIWFVGFFFEAVGDWQLMQYKKHPDHKGTIYTHGLWRFTRHPNYFGEVVQWWGVYIIAAGVLEQWAWAAVSPLIITVLILFVSGVPLMERRYAGRDDWEDYKKRTNKFIPGIPKRKKKKKTD